MPDYISPEDEERQESAALSQNALETLTKSEHMALVMTANLPNNRRKLKTFDSQLLEYATYSQPIAISMFYSLPRGGKQIIGPSVRFAEVVAPCWRNCGARVMGDSVNTVTGQGIFIDYENNLRNSIEVPRRITDKEGRRYADDMIITTSNAAMSVARRNAVLKGGVPQALWTPAYEAAQLTAVGKAQSHAQRVADAMDYLHKLGLSEWQILNAVGLHSVRDLETEHLVTLRVLCQEIKRGDKTVEEVFGSPFDKEIDALFAQLKKNQAQQRLLRESYMGRANELVEYLRGQVGPSARTTLREPAAPPPPPPPPVETEAEEPPPLPDDSARDNAPFGGNAGATGTVPAKETPAIPDDKPAIEEQAAPPPVTWDEVGRSAAPRSQVTMEPPPRRRGRPSREEVARRQTQGSLLPQEPESEQDERERAENAVDSTNFEF